MFIFFQDSKIIKMIRSNNENKGLNAFVIRIVAIIAMICSMYAQTNESKLADCLLWFSYTIFAFLMVEGINNTTNRLLYFRRMLVFTVLAEVPYDLFTFEKPWDISEQSIMLTLFIGFCICNICEYIRNKLNNSIINGVAVVVLTYLGIIAAQRLNAQFGKYGLLILMLFYVSYNLRYAKIFELALMLYYGFTVSTESVIDISINDIQYSIPIVAFAVLATFFTWTYNEKRGLNTFALKICFYLVYPVSLLAFYLLLINNIL